MEQRSTAKIFKQTVVIMKSIFDITEKDLHDAICFEIHCEENENDPFREQRLEDCEMNVHQWSEWKPIFADSETDERHCVYCSQKEYYKNRGTI